MCGCSAPLILTLSVTDIRQIHRQTLLKFNIVTQKTCVLCTNIEITVVYSVFCTHNSCVLCTPSFAAKCTKLISDKTVARCVLHM